MNNKDQFIILIDRREQCPWLFSSITPPPKIEYCTLKTGDYSLKNYETAGLCVERKSNIDLFGSTGKHRERFEKEFERMAHFKYAALIIERSLGDLIKNPPEHSRMLPKAVLHTLISWSLKYNVHVWAAPDRIFAEKLCFNLFRHFWKYQQEIEGI